MEIRIEQRGERCVAVVDHNGDLESIEDSRRPLYRHMIMEELVGGPSMIRFDSDGSFDLLVQTHVGFDGDAVCRVEELPAGRWAVADYEGPVDGVAAARNDFLAAVSAAHTPAGRLLQVHLMDEIDGETEQQFQILLEGQP